MGENLTMYNVVKTDKKVLLSNGADVTPLLTLADEFEGRAQIIMDDGCYVLCLANRVGTYNTVKHWFPEAAKALHGLISKAD